MVFNMSYVCSVMLRRKCSFDSSRAPIKEGTHGRSKGATDWTTNPRRAGPPRCDDPGARAGYWRVSELDFADRDREEPAVREHLVRDQLGARSAAGRPV